MNYENVLKTKSKQFALRIINLFQFLCKEKREVTLSRYMLVSGTEIGVQYAEAETAQNKSDFLEKLGNARDRCSATRYWLDLLFESNYIAKAEYLSLRNDCNELLKMMSALTRTLKAHLEQSA
jgi:four helix bundle protein